MHDSVFVEYDNKLHERHNLSDTIGPASPDDIDECIES